MKIIGLDPGPTITGAVVLNDGRVEFAGNLENAAVRENLLLAGAADLLAIERIASYGMPVGDDVFSTCIEVGRYVECAGRAALPVRLLRRAEVKAAICHSPKAKDANVRQALIDRYGTNSHRKGGPLYGITKHAWSALAVAILAWDEARAERAA